MEVKATLEFFFFLNEPCLCGKYAAAAWYKDGNTVQQLVWFCPVV